MPNDEQYMRFAIEEARRAAALGEVPVGAVVVQDGRIISGAYNLRESEKRATAHAELLAIEEACKRLGGWRLPRCTLYVTLEPCPMCTGAIINARIERVVFGAYDPKNGCMGSISDLTKLPNQFHVDVTGGVLADDCAELLRSFFRRLR
jgi:tRNA(adenine34) deaminase